MTDLIKKDDAIDILCESCGIAEDVQKCRKTSADGWCKEYCELKNMPSVEAIPIEWLESWFEKHNRLTLFYIILGDWERNEGNH